MTRVLVVTTLFPNTEHVNHGIFVENRVRHTLGRGGLTATVVAPVPYFPFRARCWGRYSAFARVPSVEERFGTSVLHPRFFVVPKVGTALGPRFLFQTLRRTVGDLMRSGLSFDVIDAHYFYPDGVAAAMLARQFEMPLAITGRGSDLTLLAQDAAARRQIQWAAERADALITVSESLKQALVRLGVDGERIAVLRNGVESSLFTPLSRSESRSRLGVRRFALLSVGALIPRKRHAIAIDAIGNLPDCELLIVGTGPLRAQLERRARDLGVVSRVRFFGEVPHRELPLYYNAADVMTLTSDREGWANVILEAMACGTPVIATDVGGAGEVIRVPEAGRLLLDSEPGALANEVTALRANLPSREATRRYAEAFAWEPVAAANAALLEALAQRRKLSGIAREFSVAGPSAS